MNCDINKYFEMNPLASKAFHNRFQLKFNAADKIGQKDVGH